jgi:hypothetical protein
MGIEERLLIGEVLLRELKKEAKKLHPILRPSEDLEKIIRKANAIKMQMYMCYRTWNKPPELLRQIQEMDSIIKSIEELHNKHV